MKENEMTVTPWEVSGEIDYERLIEYFGTERITDTMIRKITGLTRENHFHLRRKIFFSHRGLDWILRKYEQNEKFILYTGRGPSGDTHIGHTVPWIFTKFLQEKFDVKLYFQLTDDEKFLIKSNLSGEQAFKLTYDNALDVIAVGFDQRNTFLISDMKQADLMYNIAIRVAKHITGSTAKAVFGFNDSSNIGIQFFPAMQSAPCFIESILQGKNVPCLIPAAIDQDPYWRVTRDVAPKLGFDKPCQIHSRFLPGLGKGGKMSSSMPETCVFLTDTPPQATKKIMNAFTGGRATTKEQKKLGGNPDICGIYHYESFIFEPDDRKLQSIKEDCQNGSLLCGEHKQILAEKVTRFLIEHQKKREKAKDVVEDYFLDTEEILTSLLKRKR